MKRAYVVLLCACAIALFGAQSALAATRISYTVINNSGAARSDLHFSIVGGGGQATLVVKRNSPGCPTPQVIVLGSSGWTIDWGTLCVDVGESVELIVTTPTAVGNQFGAATWTPGDVPVDPADVTAVDADVPSLSPTGLIALAALLLVAGTLLGLRRRARQTLA
jgi:hypothetical protein